MIQCAMLLHLLSLLSLFLTCDADANPWSTRVKNSCSHVASNWTGLPGPFRNPVRDWIRSFRLSASHVVGSHVLAKVSSKRDVLVVVSYETGLTW